MDEVSPVAARVRWRALLPLLLVLLLGGAAWYGWHDWQARRQQAQERAIEDARQIDALGQRLDTLRADLRAQGRLLQDAAASNRVLRDEVLGLGQRNALLEESVARLDARARQGHQALRLDEAELLLVLGAQRLHVAGDIDGARRASANAKTWCWVATALAIIGLLLNIYMYSSGGMAEYQQWIEQMQQAQ